MSKIEVNQIDTISGSSTLLVGPSAATKLTFSSTLTVDFNVNSPGVTLNDTMKMTPAFEAYLSAEQTTTDEAATKITIDTENFDTDSAFDTSTNKFTVPSGKAGKYFLYANVRTYTNLDQNKVLRVYFYKNGSTSIPATYQVGSQFDNNRPTEMNQNISAVLDLSVGDYIELYVFTDVVGGQPAAKARPNVTYFGGYKLIGA